MTPYEIRIIRWGQQALIQTASLMGDHAAIRRARNLAGEGNFVEVWRGPARIYSTLPKHALAPG